MNTRQTEPVQTETAPTYETEQEQPAERPQIIEHTTKRGKVLRGIVRDDLTREQAREIDTYTFAKNGGWFIREKHLENIPEPAQFPPSPIHQAPVEQDPAGYQKGSVWYGGRYDSALSITDICKNIRRHLKEEAKKSPLFDQCRFSVRKNHHKSIAVTVLEMPFNPLNPERIKLEMEGKNSYGEEWYTPDGKAFFARIEALVDSYNFDGSDTISDYFHVNFYSHVNLDGDLSRTFRADIEADLENKVKAYRQALRDSLPACSRCGEKTEAVYSTADGSHAGLCWSCFHPYDREEQDRRHEEDRRKREETAQLMATIADVELIPATGEEFLDVLLPSLNKNYTLEEYEEQRESGKYEIVRGRITDRAHLTAEQYDVFTSHLLEIVSWIAGKGGCDSTADLPPETETMSFHQLTPAQQSEWKEGVYTLFIEVSAPGRETVYIDPQGHGYARYLGFAADAAPVPDNSQLTPSPVKASTDCAPINRWNNHLAVVTRPGAVRSAPAEQPIGKNNHRELWKEQGAPSQKNAVRLSIVPDQVTATCAGVTPLPSHTGHQAPPVEAKEETVTLAPLPAAKKRAGGRTVPARDLPEKDEAFYPTPDELALEMVLAIKGNPRSILDPSAGKGDLLQRIRDSYSHRSAGVYAIEIDNHLRAILQHKKIPVIDSDFLAFSGPDKFDCIVMNPPFKRGADHLLKAIEIMYSGQIVCLLNAETLRNPCTNTRKELARKLDELDAKIEFKGKRFIGAERKTPVEIALVSIVIERKVEDDLFQGADDTAEDCTETIQDEYEVSTGKRIEELVAGYNEVVRITTETILNYYRNHNKVGRYLTLNNEHRRTTWTTKKGHELTAAVQSTINGTVRTIRRDYWRSTLDLPEVKERLTQKRRSEFEECLKNNESMDFTERNIRQFLINVIDGYGKTLEDGVLEVFDRLTIRNSYHEELRTKNIHYFNGWKTNNAYRVGQRVILPVGSTWDQPFTGWNGWKLDWAAARSLDDIDLVMSYFNGGRPFVKLSEAIKEAFARGDQSGRSTFFQFKAHKKGTIHLTFLDENILRRFNVAACKGKNWLPGDYGQKPFTDMTPQEKSVVDSFEVGGESVYTANLNRPLFDATFTTVALLEAA